MAIWEELGLQRELIQRRLIFVLDRATAHMDRHAAASRESASTDRLSESPGGRLDLELACAAGLWRDAAALALILGDPGSAKKFLLQAGLQWADLGLFAGYTMMTLAGEMPWWKERRVEFEAIQEVLKTQTDGFDEGERRDGVTKAPGRAAEVRNRPFIVASVGSSRQLLNLYQSLISVPDDGDAVKETVRLVRRRLAELPESQIGTTGLPLRAYLELIDAVALGTFNDSFADRMSGLISRRTEQIEAARGDEHHWRLVLHPAELVDFDILAIATTSIDTQQSDEPLASLFGDRGSGVGLPMVAARGLRQWPLSDSFHSI